MDIRISSEEIYAIEYPAIVQNELKAIENLGGFSEVEKTFNSQNRSLRLTFRPKMVFSKPAYGEHQKSSAFILSVKRCRNKRTGEIKVFPEVIGIVTRIYRFGGMSLFVYDIQGMMDFQYGPFTKISSEGSTPKFKIFYDSLMLEGPSLSVDEYLSRDTPSYLPPMIFSRIDSVMPYNFAPRFRTSEYIKFEEKSQQMPYNRRARRTYGIFVGMNEPTPQSPNEEAIIRVNTGGDELMELSDELKRLFSIRPIWLRSALSANCSLVCRDSLMKMVLPMHAYFIMQGPWARCWIRFGYNPRQFAEAGLFQIVNFRIRSPLLYERLLGHPVRREILAGHSRTGHHAGISDSVEGLQPRSPTRMDGSAFTASRQLYSDEDEEIMLAEDKKYRTETARSIAATWAKARCLTGHQFSRVQLPTNRQVSYHLVDIKLPEVSTLLRAALLSKPGGPVEYNPIDGWLSSGYQQYTRIIMAKALRAWVFRLGDETAQSSARSNSGSRGRGLCQSRTNSALGYRRKTQ